MTLYVNPYHGPAIFGISWAAPTGAALDRLARTDRNGRREWPAANLATSCFDRTPALVGPVEYLATYTDGTREAVTKSLDITDQRPRLLRLAWEPSAGNVHLTAPGAIWTEHEAILDASYDLEDVTTVTRRGASGIHATRNYDRTDTGQLVVWCDSHAQAANLRGDLLRHPLQWLRVPDQIGMDHTIIVTRLALRYEGGATLVDIGYTTRSDLLPVPNLADGTIGRRTLGNYAGTLADLAEEHHMLAEMR